MTAVTRAMMRTVSLLVMCCLLIASAPMAQARPLTADKVHQRIAKQGLGNWVVVELQNGTAFGGRIVGIDDQSFSLQLHNDPSVTAVFYSDVVDLHTGITRRGFWILTGVGFGLVSTAAAVGFYEVHAHQQTLTLPTQPTPTVF